MSGRGTGLFLVSIMLGALFSGLPASLSVRDSTQTFEPLERLFQGFTTGDNWLNLEN